MYWLAQAPANIALIKYMGKKDPRLNLPANSSLSYTLNHLLSTVRLEALTTKTDFWEPLPIPGEGEFKLSKLGQKRFIDFIGLLKKQFNFEGGFLIQSNNNFPLGSGLASSASSFAALTQCAALAFSELTQTSLISNDEQAQLSRLGSGSSCRSFYAPWALWQDHLVSSIDLPYENLLHQVVIISSKEKKVSSSKAHLRVQTSPLYASRLEEAEANLTLLLQALKMKHWAQTYQLCWQEFQSMHHLFTTCEQPFSYMTAESMIILDKIRHLWEVKGDGPLVTMDAGPNIHLLYRTDQEELAQQFRSDNLTGNYDVL